MYTVQQFDYLCENNHLKTARKLVKVYIENCASLSMSEKLKNVEKLRKPWKSRKLSNLWAQFQSNKASFSDAIDAIDEVKLIWG